MCNQCNDSNQAHVPAVLSRREALKAGAAIALTPLLGGVEAAKTWAAADRPEPAQPGEVRATGAEWLSYSGDKASSKYSPLTQISGDNFNRLRVAWTWRSAEEEVAKANNLKIWVWEATPLMAGGFLLSALHSPKLRP